MAGLNHEFYLLNYEEYPIFDKHAEINVEKLHRTKNSLKIHDDHLRYFSDTFLWIPTYITWKNKKIQGLDFWGETVIKIDGAKIGKEIFENWSNLFRLAPESFELTGNYTFAISENENGNYEKLNINREKIVNQLETLAYYCNEVVLSNDKKFIWHFGI
jgi:hypothetical protein